MDLRAERDGAWTRVNAPSNTRRHEPAEDRL